MTFEEIRAKALEPYENVNAELDAKLINLRHKGEELGYSPEQVMKPTFGWHVIELTEFALEHNILLENFHEILSDVPGDNWVDMLKILGDL